MTRLRPRWRPGASLAGPRVVAPVLAAALIVLTGAACGASKSSTGSDGTTPRDDAIVRVVASTNVWGDLAARVGGEHISVQSILTDTSQDPHSFDADPRTQLA